MTIEFKLLVYYIISVVCTLAITPLAIRLSSKIRFVDGTKNQKRMSDTPIPLLGGTLIFTFFWSSVFFFVNSIFDIKLFLLCSSIFLLGLFDDYLNYRPSIKFSIPLVICLFSIYYYEIQVFDNKWLNIIFSILWIYGLTNSFNFLDNMDGITAGVVSIKTIFLVILSYILEQDVFALTFAILGGLNLGFLYYNYNPAKIYLGDSGSLFQGFIISILLINFDWGFEDISIKFFAPALLLGYTIVDTTFVTTTRIINGHKPWIGDTNHTTHKLVKLGFSVKQTSVIVYFLTVFYCMSGILLLLLEIYYGYFIIFLNMVITFYYYFFLTKAKFEK